MIEHSRKTKDTEKKFKEDYKMKNFNAVFIDLVILNQDEPMLLS